MLRVNQRHKLIFKFDEIYYAKDYQTATSDADVSMFLFCKNYPEGLKKKIKVNMIKDLRKSEEDILEECTRNTRTEIRGILRNDKVELVRDTKPTLHKLQEFCNFFNDFSRQKNIYKITPMNLIPFVEEDAFCLTKMVEKETGTTLCYVSYFFDEDRVTAHYACSHFRLSNESTYRNLIGRGNKAMHYLNMLDFKKRGISTYDFGGYQLNDEGGPRTGVDEFKERFGGTVITEYAFYYPRTAKGRLALRLRPQNPEML